MRMKSIMILAVMIAVIAALVFYLGVDIGTDGEGSLEELRIKLQSPDPRVRATAIYEASHLESEDYKRSLRNHLEDPDTRVRLATCTQLLMLGQESCYEQIIAMLSSDKPSFQDKMSVGEAAEATLLLYHREYFPKLIDHLNDRDPEVRVRVFSLVKKISRLKTNKEKDFGYNPNASQKERLKAMDEWRRWWQAQEA